MKNVKVLGSGCKNCVKTAELIEKTAKELGVDVELEKVTDIAEIMALGVMSTPGVIVDGLVCHVGSVPDKEMVTKMLS